MKQMVRGLIEKVRGIRNKFKYKRVVNSLDNSNDTGYVDLGASNIKMSYQWDILTFRSSIRKVLLEDEITVQKNAIRCNGSWYIVGEASTPTGNYEYKYKKRILRSINIIWIKYVGG